MSTEPLAFLHGWGTHPVIWEPLQTFFPGMKALPLPGYAGSGAVLTLEEMTETIAGKLGEGTALVGWSLGGHVAVNVALAWPEKVARLILIGATPCFVNRNDWPHGVEGEVFAQFADSLAQDYAGTIRRFLSLQAQGSSEMREVLAQLRRRLLDQTRPAEGVLEAGLEILQGTDLRESIVNIEVPLTLIHGTGDKLAPLEAARWLADAVPDARLHEIQGAGHAPFLSHPRQVADIIGCALHG